MERGKEEFGVLVVDVGRFVSDLGSEGIAFVLVLSLRYIVGNYSSIITE